MCNFIFFFSLLGRDPTRDGWIKECIKQKVLGCFGQSGLQRKKPPHCHKYATFLGVFLCFQGQKEIFVYASGYVYLSSILQKIVVLSAVRTQGICTQGSFNEVTIFLSNPLK